MTVHSHTVWRLLVALATCRRRNKDLSTKVVQLTQSREKWKAKAISRGNELRRLRRKPPKRTVPLEYGPDIVARILQIPLRDIE